MPTAAAKKTLEALLAEVNAATLSPTAASAVRIKKELESRGAEAYKATALAVPIADQACFSFSKKFGKCKDAAAGSYVDSCTV